MWQRYVFEGYQDFKRRTARLVQQDTGLKTLFEEKAS